MKILHTADWHIGQLFHEYDRSFEHQQFLNWLTTTLNKEQIDVLLISGDVFDLTNPSAASVKLFYTFLNQAVKTNPELQIIITAGNHDSPSRLESPKPLLESSNIHIIGLIEKDDQAAIDFSKITLPLKDKNGDIQAWCIAAPFLRSGDYPTRSDCDNPYAEGVAAFYKAAFEYAATQKQTGQSIIAMGHLHASQASISDTDNMERLIMGGIECISASAFHDDIAYVALGHIHKAQKVGGKAHIRYSGSPLPMSFSERNYKHQVIVFELEEGKISRLETIEIPVSVPLMRVPSVHSPLNEVLHSLSQLQPFEGAAITAPYLEVCILAEGPEPGLRHKITAAIEGKNYRLARIDLRYKTTATTTAPKDNNSDPEQLTKIRPLDLLQQAYRNKYNHPLPDTLIPLFQQAEREVNETEA